LYEIYRQINGDGFATLIKNKLQLKDEFRIIASLVDRDSMFYDIIPYLKGTLHNLELNYISRKRRFNSTNGIDFIDLNNNNNNNGNIKINTKIFNGPVEMYAQVLLYIDISNYNNHAKMADTRDENTILLHILVYYIHFMNGVNQRYANSFSNDPHLRFTIGLTNIIVETETPLWYNNSKRFNSNGLELLDAEEGIRLFRLFLEKQNLKFNYDFAAALL
jgi:hypothetical protein